MTEVKQIKSLVKPTETILVADSLTGQIAVNVASEFDKAVNISSIILTRVDGDGRGGAALSMKEVTGKPIKLMGVGEKIDELESFHPERIAKRILGMGDIVSLVEKATKDLDEKKLKDTEAQLKEGIFTMENYLSQLRQMKKMGGMGSVMSMLPGANKIKQQMENSCKHRRVKTDRQTCTTGTSLDSPEITKKSEKKMNLEASKCVHVAFPRPRTQRKPPTYGAKRSPPSSHQAAPSGKISGS